MSTNTSRERIELQLARVRGRIRRAQWTRMAWQTGAVATGGMLALMAVDHFLSPPPWTRAALLGATGIALGITLIRGLKPLRRKIGLVQVARWLEERHPEMEERLSTVLEVDGTAGVSQALLEELAQAADRDAGTVDARSEVRAAATFSRWRISALLGSGALLLLLAAWPGEISRLAWRAVAPFSATGNAAAVRFEVTPGSVELLEGDALEIAARYRGTADSLQVAISVAGQELVEPMLPAGDVWRFRLEPVRESLTYQVRSGRGRSDSYDVRVWPLPALVSPRAVARPPSYTGLPPSDEPLGRVLEVLRGSSLTLSASLNTPVESSWIERDGKRVAEARVESAADGGRVVIDWKPEADESGEFLWRMKHRLGREVDGLAFTLRLLPDEPPVVRWISPAATSLRVRPDELLQISYEVAEDIGLAATALEVKSGEGEPLRLPLDAPRKRPGPATVPRYRGEGSVSVGELVSRLSPQGALQVRVRAEDIRPAEMEGPGVGTSPWLLLEIDRQAESLAMQAFREAQDGSRESMNRAIQAAREAADRMNRHRGDMEKETPDPHAKKGLAEARERLSDARQELEKLAERMEESAHAAKADEVREASETLAAASQELESAPLQDGTERRQQKLDDARQLTEQAVRQLEQAREAVERDRRKAEELARVQELAARQRELARQAERQAEAATRQPATQEWQENQRQVEERLRQHLREQPEARALAQEAQAETARELAAQAREMAESQKSLAAKPESDAASAEALREALAKEQDRISEQTQEALTAASESAQPAADHLPAATEAGKKAAEELRQSDAASAASEAAKAAEAMKAAAATEKAASPGESAAQKPEGEKGQQQNQAGPLEALAGQQQQVAEAADALARGETEAARDALRDLQSAATRELAQEVAAVPMPEGSGAMNEARRHSREGGEQAAQAAEAATQGKAEDAANRHERAASSLEQSAAALEQSAEEAGRRAEEDRGRTADGNRLPLDAENLSQAFEAAARATGQPEASQSAARANQAADALDRAAQAALQQMQGRGEGKPQNPGPADGATPGERPEEGPRPQQADPGVPPELARLGISAEDWEKIRATMNADVGSGGGEGVPEEYRGLVKRYFQAMTQDEP